MTFVDCIIGPMFAGKTTKLLERVIYMENHFNDKENTIIITHSIDKERTSLLNDERIVTVSSHSKETRELSKRFQTIRTDKLYLLDSIISNKTIIGIDECQFFDKDEFVNTIKNWLYKFKNIKYIILVGLDGDINQKPFPGSGIFDIMPLCNKIEKLQGAYCTICKSPASFTTLTKMEINKDKKDFIKVGGSETYQAVCRKHI